MPGPYFDWRYLPGHFPAHVPGRDEQQFITMASRGDSKRKDKGSGWGEYDRQMKRERAYRRAKKRQR